MEDITQLQQLLNDTTQTNTTTTTTSISHSLEQLVFWVVVPSIVMLVVFVIALIAAAIRRHRVDHAIFEIRDILRDMQAQQQAAAPMSKVSEPIEPAAKSS